MSKACCKVDHFANSSFVDSVVGAPTFAEADGAYVAGCPKKDLSTLSTNEAEVRLAKCDSMNSLTTAPSGGFDSYWREQEREERQLQKTLNSSAKLLEKLNLAGDAEAGGSDNKGHACQGLGAAESGEVDQGKVLPTNPNNDKVQGDLGPEKANPGMNPLEKNTDQQGEKVEPKPNSENMEKPQAVEPPPEKEVESQQALSGTASMPKDLKSTTLTEDSDEDIAKGKVSSKKFDKFYHRLLGCCVCWISLALDTVLNILSFECLYV